MVVYVKIDNRHHFKETLRKVALTADLSIDSTESVNFLLIVNYCYLLLENVDQISNSDDDILFLKFRRKQT